MGGERAFIERLRKLLPAPPPSEVWAGDDAAVLADGLLLTTDALVAGVHFRSEWCRWADVGWKALAVGVSDIAAMGGSPSAAVVAVVIPPGRPGVASELLAGASEAADELACPLVGGDTVSGSEVVVSVTVVGRVPPEGAVLRSGARPGHSLFVTGPLGGAKRAVDLLRRGRVPPPELATRLHRPVPRVAEGQAAAAAGATAMIDVSDGLALDLARLCEESDIGARLFEPALPRPAGVSLDDALSGGDDYELLFAAPDAAAVERTFAGRGLPLPACIGEVTEGRGRRLVTAAGAERELPVRGWEHPVP